MRYMLRHEVDPRHKSAYVAWQEAPRDLPLISTSTMYNLITLLQRHEQQRMCILV